MQSPEGGGVCEGCEGVDMFCREESVTTKRSRVLLSGCGFFHDDPALTHVARWLIESFNKDESNVNGLLHVLHNLSVQLKVRDLGDLCSWLWERVREDRC